ncbi:hypothetical protein BDQ17DRAFT_1334722 [Cyathus striatus]|nr:hypothetical protein BDQ17DRAFT_1334722 [Cyathus striatus]
MLSPSRLSPCMLSPLYAIVCCAIGRYEVVEVVVVRYEVVVVVVEVVVLRSEVEVVRGGGGVEERGGGATWTRERAGNACPRHLPDEGMEMLANLRENGEGGNGESARGGARLGLTWLRVVLHTEEGGDVTTGRRGGTRTRGCMTTLATGFERGRVQRARGLRKREGGRAEEGRRRENIVIDDADDIECAGSDSGDGT